jgi:hypothetical protein
MKLSFFGDKNQKILFMARDVRIIKAIDVIKDV